ncbi:hypothetical protein SEEB0197_03642, partial [Salmonella enterica subsp. enterica serovar Bareilly str. CFSAN000197]
GGIIHDSKNGIIGGGIQRREHATRQHNYSGYCLQKLHLYRVRTTKKETTTVPETFIGINDKRPWKGSEL